MEFHRPESPEQIVGTARWDGASAFVEAERDEVRAALLRVFRPAPVAIDDASYRRQGTSGEVVIQPGSLQWFRAVAFARAPEAGLVARAVPGVTEGGWDPAAGFRTFSQSIDDLESGA